MSKRRIFPFRKKSLISFQDYMGSDNPFPTEDRFLTSDPYRVHSWVNIAVGILMRNVGRATFKIMKEGNPVETGPVFSLFRDVNPQSNRFDLWKETTAWWFLEGEAFWYFGSDYSAGIPKEIFVLNPRKLRSFSPGGTVTRWFYSTPLGEFPIFPDEMIHFKEWNPWNPLRGVSPLIALNHEIEQDVRSNRTTSSLLKNDAVPEGLLKTDQVLREEEADRLEKRWAQSYGKSAESRRIAVLGKGTQFQPLSITPAAMKYYDMKRWNLYTLLAKYGIPPRVAQIQDSHSSLSGTDTSEQHAAFWKYTIIPTLKNYEQILETQFFSRFNLAERGTFDTSDIPELQESADGRSKRDIAEIEAGLRTINDVLAERGLEPKPWGDEWHNKPGDDNKLNKSVFFNNKVTDDYIRNLISHYLISDETCLSQEQKDNIVEYLKNHCSTRNERAEDLRDYILMALTQICLIPFPILERIINPKENNSPKPTKEETNHLAPQNFGIPYRRQSHTNDSEGDPLP